MKRAPSILLFLLAVTLGTAQPVTRVWLKTTSLAGTDNYEDLVLDSLGNAFVCGSTIVAGKYQMLVVKFDKDGNKIWERTFPGAIGSSGGKSIARDPNGHVIVSGFTSWISPGEMHSRIIKVSAAGQLLWDQVGTSAVGSLWYDVAVDGLGEVTATGYSKTAAGKVLRSSHFLANGTLVWNRDYSYPGVAATADQHGVFVNVDTSRNIYVCAVHNDFPGDTDNTIVKYSPDGTQQWMRHFTNGYRDYPRGFSLAPGNLMHMVCQTTLPNGNLGSSFVTYQTDGTKTDHFFHWTETGSPSIVGLAVDPQGTWAYGGHVPVPSGNLPYWVNYQPGGYTPNFEDTLMEPDRQIRALAAGLGNRDFYYGIDRFGTGPRPATIRGIPAGFTGRSLIENHLWEQKIYGSTANGQTPYANVTGLASDSKGDVIAIGNFSGSSSQDCFIAKYETGPIARPDLIVAQSATTYTSPLGGYLLNDHQVSQATRVITVQPQHGTLTAQTDGSYTYQPDPAFAGTDRFDYALTRTNGIAIRTASSFTALYVRPNLLSLSLSTTMAVGGELVYAQVAIQQIAAEELSISLKSSSNTGIDSIESAKIAMGDQTGTGKIYTETVSAPKTVVITATSGTSSLTRNLTINP